MGILIAKFISDNVPKLVSQVENYLIGVISHGEMYDYTCQVIDDWYKLGKVRLDEPYIEREKQFWALLWAVQALASRNHWAEGLPQRELPVLLEVLKTNGGAVEGYDYRRPNPLRCENS